LLWLTYEIRFVGCRVAKYIYIFVSIRAVTVLLANNVRKRKIPEPIPPIGDVLRAFAHEPITEPLWNEGRLYDKSTPPH
jgi:hypothetical protein